MSDQVQKDPNVFSFMMEMVQKKHGDEVSADFLTVEANRLYDGFGDALVDFFEPLMTDEQKHEFDRIVENGGDQNPVLEFLMRSIPSLDDKIKKVLVLYRNTYLKDSNI